MEPQSATTPRLVRRPEGRMIAGVCKGIADHFGIDPTLVRIAFIVVTFVGGAGAVAYGAAWLLIPEEGETTGIGERVVREHRWGRIAGFVLIAIAITTLARPVWWIGGHSLFAVLLIVGGLYLLSPGFDGRGAGPTTADSAPTLDGPDVRVAVHAGVPTPARAGAGAAAPEAPRRSRCAHVRAAVHRRGRGRSAVGGRQRHRVGVRVRRRIARRRRGPRGQHLVRSQLRADPTGHRARRTDVDQHRHRRTDHGRCRRPTRDAVLRRRSPGRVPPRHRRAATRPQPLELRTGIGAHRQGFRRNRLAARDGPPERDRRAPWSRGTSASSDCSTNARAASTSTDDSTQSAGSESAPRLILDVEVGIGEVRVSDATS